MSDTTAPAGAAHDDGPPTVPSDWAALKPLARPEPVAHALAFSASGSEYFRIWIVNLLLTLVTLGLYYPWAKVRKLRYFYGNTRLAGHAFDFHGDPKRMLRGYLLTSGLFIAYALASNLSPVAGVIALTIIAAIWPALLRASLRFRMAQTSWRGLRFGFNGDTAGAYKALLPAFATAILFVAVAVALTPDMPAEGETVRPMSGFGVFLLFVVTVLMALTTPLTFWLLKRYQHGHYQYASVHSRFTAGIGSFYALFGKAIALAVGCAFAGGLLVALFGGLGAAGRGGGLGVLGFLLFMITIVAIYAVILFGVQPYITSRLQNLVWPSTETHAVTFQSDLRFWPLARLTAVNWFLIALTLGLYWPFAAVAVARMRLQAMTVVARTDLDGLVARRGADGEDASGDAAADVFGIDLGM